MRCNPVLHQLDAFRTRELALSEASALEAHLASCAACTAALRDLTSTARELKALLVAAPASLRTTLLDSYATLVEGDERLWVAFNRDGIRLVHRGTSFNDFASLHAKRFGTALREGLLPDVLRAQLLDALRGRGTRKPTVAFRSGRPPLEREVLETLTKIPRGEVRTYEWVARQVGRPRAVRAVGNVCASNVVPLLIPCHRVVPSSGGLGEYVFGSRTKRELLRREGVDVDRLESLASQHVRLIGSRTTKIVCFPTCRDAKRIRPENEILFAVPAKALAAGFRPCMHCQPFAAQP